MINYENMSKTIAAYFPEGESIYNNENRVYINEGYTDYVPVVDYSMQAIETDLDIVNVSNREKTVKAYNKNKTSASFRRDIVEEKKLDLTANDLSIGKQLFVLNFTDRSINMVDDQGIPKIYPPINNSSLKCYLGKIIIFEINRLNTVEFISRYGGIDNYLELFNDIKGNVGLSTRVMVKLTGIVETSLKLYDKARFHNEGPRSNSIKVVNMVDLGSDYINELIAGDTLYLAEYNVTLSMERSNFSEPNPYTTREFQFQLESFNAGGITDVRAFINDPYNEITDRYMCVGDAVVKIKKISDPTNTPLFRMVFQTEDGKYDHIEEKLEMIDSLPFIFKTREEARHGMHKDKVKETEINERKLDLEKERIIKDIAKTTLRSEVDERKLSTELEKLGINKELEELRRELELQKAELERDRMEWEREKHNLTIRKSEEDFRMELHKAELERERELMKFQIMNYGHDKTKESESMKFHYDIQRANADTTLQTLKVVGGVAALGVAAFTLYKKLT